MPFILLFLLLLAGTAAYMYFSNQTIQITTARSLKSSLFFP